MQKRPIAIALTIAGIIAGTTAGIAAINTEGTLAEPVAQQSAAEVQAPVEAQTAVETQTPVAVEAQAPAETATPAPVAVPPVTESVRPAARNTADERMVRIPFTNRYVRVTNPTFPSAGVEMPDPLPGVVAYFDNRNANVKLAGAPGSVFPSAAIEQSEPLPATLAYFDQLEARRIAAARPSPTANSAGVGAPLAGLDLPATVRPSTAEARVEPAVQSAGGN